MSSVRVVADSTAYLPEDIVGEYGITVVPLYYELAGQGLRRETDLEDFGPFYEDLVAAGEVARTSPPSVADFVNTYEPLLADGSSVVSIHLSSGISETTANARHAAAQLADSGGGGERVHVIDSSSGCGHLGLIVLAAARLARTAGIDEVVARAREARAEATFRFTIDTLEFLRRGGRIGTAAAWMGSALSIKPILTVQSEVKALERVRTRARAVERLIEFARRQAAAGADAWFVNHGAAGEDARQFEDRLQEIFWRPPEFHAEVGPVIGTHLGPGMLMVGAMPSRLLD